MARSLSSPSLVGREAELARLSAALQRVEAGEPATILVAGEAGVGKTRLLTEFLRRAEAARAHVLLGGCLELGATSLPYAPFVEALRGLHRRLPPGRLAELAGPGRADLARILPELGQVDPEPPATPVERAQLGLFEHLLGLLERLGDQAPLVLALEDLHWSDRSTRDLLTFLVHSLAGTRVLLVATYRADELNRQHPLRPLLARFERDPRVERLDLRPLDRAELVELLTGLLRQEPDIRLVDQVFARSEGNPFFAEELIAAARDGTAAALPPTLREVLLARVEGLPTDTQTVLRVAAAAGREVDHELLAAVAGLDGPRLLNALRTAVAEQLLTTQPDTLGYSFRHALLAEAVHDDLLPGERTGLHAELARVLQERPGLAGGAELSGVLAWHWWAAHDQPRALAASVAAARAAEEAYAYAEALRHLERALELWEVVPDAAERAGADLVELLKRAAANAGRAGDQQRAVALARRALDLTDPSADPVRAGLLRMLLAVALCEIGRDGAVEAFEEAIRLVPATPASPARARVLAAYAADLMVRPRFTLARRLAEEAVSVAQAAGALSDELDARVSLGVSLMGLGETEAGIAQLRQADTLAERSDKVYQRLRVAVNLSDALAHIGDLEGGVKLALEGADLARRHGIERGKGAFLLCNAAEFLLDLGRLDEAEPLIRQARSIDTGSRSGLHARMLHARLELDRGALAAADRVLAEIDVHVSAVGEAQFSAPLAALRTRLALYQGRLDDARRLVAEGLDAIAEADGARVFGGELYALGLRAEADRGGEQAQSVAGGLRDRLRAELALPVRIFPAFAAWALLAEAEWCRLLEQDDPQHWEQAVNAFDALSRPLPAAYARQRAAAALLARGDREDARAALLAAWEVAEQLGAEPLRADVERLARRGRIDLVAAVPLEDAFALTPREAEVLRLVAEGRSNRQIGEALFISTKTASVHVSNILAKLGVDGRGEAAALAHRLGLAEAS